MNLKNETLGFLLILLFSACSNRFPCCKNNFNNSYLVVDHNKVEHKQILDCETIINLNDYSDEAKFIYLRKGKRATIKSSKSTPIFLLNNKKLKMNVLIINKHIKEEHVEKIKTNLKGILPLTNTLINNLKFGYKIKLNSFEAINYNCDNSGSRSLIINNIFKSIDKKRGFYLILTNEVKILKKNHDAIRENINGTEFIFTRENVLNAVILAHEIMHTKLVDIEKEDNIMHTTSPYLGSIYVLNSQYVKNLSKPIDFPVNVANKQESFSSSDVNTEHWSTLISTRYQQDHLFSIENMLKNNVKYLLSSSDDNLILDETVTGLSSNKEIRNISKKINEYKLTRTEVSSNYRLVKILPNLLHPEKINKNTKGFSENINVHTNELRTGQLPIALEFFLKSIYENQYQNLNTKWQYKNNKILITIANLFSKKTITKPNYVRISLENFKEIRVWNLLHWLAARESAGNFNNTIILNVVNNSPNLRKKYNEIRSMY